MYLTYEYLVAVLGFHYQNLNDVPLELIDKKTYMLILIHQVLFVLLIHQVAHYYVHVCKITVLKKLYSHLFKEEYPINKEIKYLYLKYQKHLQ